MGGKKKAGGDADKGAKVFKNMCAICHAMGANGTGPKLGGVVGRATATADGFSYSGALSGKGGKWTEKNLDKYLKSPADYAPGKYHYMTIVFWAGKTIFEVVHYHLKKVDCFVNK